MFRCRICGLSPSLDDNEWITLIFHNDPDRPNTGYLCSLDHLAEFVAKAYAMYHDPDHPGWEAVEESQ